MDQEDKNQTDSQMLKRLLEDNARFAEYQARIEAIRAMPSWNYSETSFEKHERKLVDLQKNIEMVINASEIERAFDAAEECVRILNYLDDLVQSAIVQKKARRARRKGNKIDPLHTLIDRLLEMHFVDYAEQVSTVYLYLLAKRYADEST